ncbi:MAG: hypothetical protein ACRCZP_19130 [Phycicoccus sp.]
MPIMVRPRIVAATSQGITHGHQLTTANTGIPAGTSLTTQSIGSAEITTGAVDTIFSPSTFCNITADSATFTRCRFLGGTQLTIANDCTFVECEFPGGLSVSSSSRTSFTRCRMHTAAGDLCHITGDQGGPPLDQCTDLDFVECLLHSPTPGPGDHADAMQIRGALRLHLLRCRLDLGTFVPEHNAAIFPQNANGGNADMRVEDCYLNGGGYTVYLSAVAGGNEWIGNRFGPDAQFGRVENGALIVPTVWTGNVIHASGVTVPYS